MPIFNPADNVRCAALEHVLGVDTIFVHTPASLAGMSIEERDRHRAVLTRAIAVLRTQLGRLETVEETHANTRTGAVP